MTDLPPPPDADGLEEYFTDVEHLRELFRTLVAAPALPRRILLIHGVGGVGKSSLLRMFRLHCRRAVVPAAFASSDDTRSAADALGSWAAQLKADGLRLPALERTLAEYRALQAQVEERARKARETREQAASTLGKTAARSAAQALIGTIPLVGPLLSELGGSGAEAMVDWLQSFLSRAEVDLLLDPAARLTADALADLAQAAAARRLVLMLDTFEQIGALEDWTRDLARRLHPNILLVISGRAVPDWSRQWSGWMAQAEVCELAPMPPQVMRDLIARYYATMRGGAPDPAQVEAIVAFARGLPVVVTSAVRLWVQYGVEDFQSVRPQVVADLVDRLLEGVPPALLPLLEAAAALRWFNRDLLQSLAETPELGGAYDDLRRFPFIRPRPEGLALHDTVREMIDESLRVHAPARHRALHTRAAEIFARRADQAGGPERERAELELLYHRIRADEADGMRMALDLAETMTRYVQTERLRGLLSDLESQPLEQPLHRLWREFYRLGVLDMHGDAGAAEPGYRALLEHPAADSRLRAAVLDKQAEIASRTPSLSRPDGLARLEATVRQARTLLSASDPKLAAILDRLSHGYYKSGRFSEALQQLQQALSIYEQRQDRYGVATELNTMQIVYAMQGDWRQMIASSQRGLALMRDTGARESSTYCNLLSGAAVSWCHAGRYAELQAPIGESIAIKQRTGDRYIGHDYQRLAYVLGLQRRYQEAERTFQQALESYAPLGWRDNPAIARLQAEICALQGRLAEAAALAGQSYASNRVHPTQRFLIENHSLLGLLAEVQGDWSEAADHYQRCLEPSQVTRLYFACAALAGLARARQAQGDYAAIPALLARAEELAQRYEYNDLLAALRLTQGHLTWDGLLPGGPRGFNAALACYQQALVYALRYNRFKLDEVLWGDGVVTPLRPIVPRCQEATFEGQRMLAALRDWWCGAANDLGAPRADTIAPIPEGLALGEAEQIARAREPGDGAPQTALAARIEQVLAG